MVDLTANIELSISKWRNVNKAVLLGISERKVISFTSVLLWHRYVAKSGAVTVGPSLVFLYIQQAIIDEAHQIFFEVPEASSITNHTPWLTVEVPETKFPTFWKDERPDIVHLHLPFALQVPKLVAIDHLGS